jgi:hypothetical protein
MGYRNTKELRKAVEGADFIFIAQDDNWADEMDVKGYKVCSKNEFEALVSLLDNSHFPITRYFGTNEEGEYNDIEDFLYWWTVKPISEVEYHSFVNIFGDDEAGSFYLPECKYNCYKCEEEELESEEGDDDENL